MKKTTILLLLFICSTAAFAQFKFSGKISHYSGNADLKINIPLVYGFYPKNSINIPVAKNGSFSITLPVKNKKFANLMFQNNVHCMLLSANKNLTVNLNEQDKKVTFLSGTALPENKLLENININEFLFFLQNDDVYTRLNLADMNNRIVKPYFATRDKKIAVVNQSPIDLKDKKLIAAEIKYAAYNNLYEMTGLGSENKSTIDRAIVDVFDRTTVKPDANPAGPHYYIFANNYLGYMETKAYLKIKTENIKQNQAMPYFGIRLDSANILAEKYGKPYMRWVEANKLLPDAVTEQLTYQQIIHAFYDKDIKLADALAKAFINKFPASVYKADIKKKLNTLK